MSDYSRMRSLRAADTATAGWLRERNPHWTDQDVNWSIARSHVIDDHPNWDDAQVDREVTRRVQAMQEGTAHE